MPWFLIEQRAATVLPLAMTFVFDAEYRAQNSSIAVVRDARVQRPKKTYPLNIPLGNRFAGGEHSSVFLAEV